MKVKHKSIIMDVEGGSMRKPLISIIIPTYNRPIGLAECLESILKQQYEPLQIIIVNDCGDPVDSIAALYPELEIKIVNLTQNSHHVVARNQGLIHVRADFIMLCDDDDLLLPGHIEWMLAEIEDADLVYSDAEIVEYMTSDQVRKPVSRRLFAYGQDLVGMRQFSTFIPSGCLFRKQLIADIGEFDAAMRNYWDWDFYLRAADHHRVRRLPIASVLYAFSPQGGNLSNQLDNMRPYLDKLSAKHHLGDLPTKNFYLLLEEPDIMKRQAASQVIWDGKPMISRIASHSK